MQFGGQENGVPSFDLTRKIVEPIVTKPKPNVTVHTRTSIVNNPDTGKPEIVKTRLPPVVTPAKVVPASSAEPILSPSPSPSLFPVVAAKPENTQPVAVVVPKPSPISTVPEKPDVRTKSSSSNRADSVLSLSFTDANLRTEILGYINDLLAIEFRYVHPTGGTTGVPQFLKWYPGNQSAEWGTGGVPDTTGATKYMVYQITDDTTTPPTGGFGWVKARA